jgi:hypothetical protein
MVDPSEQMPGMRVVTICVEERAMLFDGEHLLARREHRVELFGRQLGHARPLPPGVCVARKSIRTVQSPSLET